MSRWESIGWRSYRSSDGAYEIMFCANANRSSGGYGAWRVDRMVGPFPLQVAECSAFFDTMRECKRWAVENARLIPLPVKVAR